MGGRGEIRESDILFRGSCLCGHHSNCTEYVLMHTSRRSPQVQPAKTTSSHPRGHNKALAGMTVLTRAFLSSHELYVELTYHI